MPVVMVEGRQKQVEKGTTFEALAKEYQERYPEKITLVSFNSKMQELSKRVEKDGVLTFLTVKDDSGHKTYCRTAQMMLVKAVRDILGTDAKVNIEFLLGNGYYCIVRGTDAVIDDALAERVAERMREMQQQDLAITKKTYPRDAAIELFSRQGMEDKVKLFHYRRGSTINVYSLDGFYDYFYGYMMPRTGNVDLFEVQAYRDGLLLLLPTKEEPTKILPHRDSPMLFEQLMLSDAWGKLTGVETVGDLNDQICGGAFNDLVLVEEALQERRIAEIARQVHEKEDLKIVMIAGPSSSGKTTFANRLCIQLRTFGLKPHIISMDNYFVNREKTPIDEDGNYDFDVLEALDLDLFADDMNDLLDGEEVELPVFDFKLGKRVYRGNFLKLGEEDILVIEGIHGLNPRCLEDLPEDAVFKIYISALTSLNIDAHNRIPTSDVRLIRRMVRDARTRNYDARGTIAGWKKVRRGEERGIFPFQDNADAVFNSTIVYELTVLKQYAEPLLFSVPAGTPEYVEAKRLLKFLDYVVGADTTALPMNSICREFVGGGCFAV